MSHKLDDTNDSVIDALFEKNMFILSCLIPVYEKDNSVPPIILDNIIRLAGITSKPEVNCESSDCSGLVLKVKNLSPQEAALLRAFLKSSDMGNELFKIEAASMEKIAILALQEILRQVKEQQELLLPYFSMQNAGYTFLLVLESIIDMLLQYEADPEFSLPLARLSAILEKGDFGLEFFEKHADDIFTHANKILEFARHHVFADPEQEAEKQNMLDQLRLIEVLFIVKQKQLLLASATLPPLDRNSHFFLSKPAADAAFDSPFLIKKAI